MDRPADNDDGIAWVRQSWSEVDERFGTGSTHLNFTGRAQGEAETSLEDASGRNLRRLAEVKGVYYPDNFFRRTTTSRPAEGAPSRVTPPMAPAAGRSLAPSPHPRGTSSSTITRQGCTSGLVGSRASDLRRPRSANAEAVELARDFRRVAQCSPTSRPCLRTTGRRSD